MLLQLLVLLQLQLLVLLQHLHHAQNQLLAAATPIHVPSQLVRSCFRV
jgi:hypothetical protein